MTIRNLKNVVTSAASRKLLPSPAPCSRGFHRLINATSTTKPTLFDMTNSHIDLRMTAPTTVSRRNYRGDSGEATKVLSEAEEALLRIAKPKADKMYEEYIQLPPEEDDGNGNGSYKSQAVRRKRLIYRSKQRGWLEVDLLLGTWANENVPNLSDEELDQFEDFVNMETIDIYNVITLRTDIPNEMKLDGGHIVEKIQEWCKTSPLGKADIETYQKVKAEKNLI